MMGKWNKMNLKKYSVYDTKNNDEFLGKYTCKDIADALDVSEQTIREDMRRCSCVRKRFFVVYEE